MLVDMSTSSEKGGEWALGTPTAPFSTKGCCSAVTYKRCGLKPRGNMNVNLIRMNSMDRSLGLMREELIGKCKHNQRTGWRLNGTTATTGP